LEYYISEAEKLQKQLDEIDGNKTTENTLKEKELEKDSFPEAVADNTGEPLVADATESKPKKRGRPKRR
jgi:hypothetical protein